MNAFQPTSLPFLVTIFAVLMFASAVLSGASQRVGVPVVLAFLVLSIVAGRIGLSQILAQNYRSYFNFGTIALILILFDGGLNTPLALLGRGLAPAALLATVGVVGTAALIALCTRLFNFSWPQAFLLGAIVAPTDAAAVFPILRGSGLQLKRRVGTTLELESGLNDPVAVVLTIILTRNLADHRALALGSLASIPVALIIGGMLGLAIGYGGRFLLPRLRVLAGGLYPIITLALALCCWGAGSLLLGSGFLAVYAAAVVLGNGTLPYRAGILRVHDAVAWLCQIVLYLLLGSFAVPSELLGVAPTGIMIGLFLAFVARPVSVALCLLPFRYSLRETLYVGWVGLRGAVPIVLAIYPLLIGVDGAREIFNIVFFVVVVSTIVPGATVRWVTARLDLKSDEQTPPPALLEIISTRVLTGAEILSFCVNRSAAACGAQLSELPFPTESTVILLIRDSKLIAPRGSTVLLVDDHVYVLCRPEDRPLIYLIFGRSEGD